MSTFFFTLLTGGVWMALNGELGWLTFAVGAGLGVLICRLEGAVALRPFSPWRALRVVVLGVRFLGSFLVELAIANLEQLRIVLAPRIEVHPGWLRFRTELETPAMRALLGTLLTLTPGSLTFDEREDPNGGWTIGIHVIDARNEAEVVGRIRRRIEAPLRRIEAL